MGEQLELLLEWSRTMAIGREASRTMIKNLLREYVEKRERGTPE
jgi:hypothetical protein